MSLSELLLQKEANITIAIGLDDLRQFHEEIAQNATSQQEQIIREKSEVEYLSPAEVCKIYKVGRATLSRWQTKGYLVPSKMGGKCKYRKSEIEVILNTKKV